MDWYSRQYALTWRMKVTKSHRFAFQLVPRVRRIGETGGGLLPTPMAQDTIERKNKAYVTSRHQRGMPITLAMQLAVLPKILPTPTISGNHNRAGLSEKSGDGLATRLAMLPTPQARDFRSPDKPDSNNFQRKVKEGYTIDLNSTIAILPTVRAQVWKGEVSKDALFRKDAKSRMDQLENVVAHNGTSTGLKLQPAFAAWMMGYPEDWTLRPFLAIHDTQQENGEKKA